MELRRLDCHGDVESFQYDVAMENEIQKSIMDSFDERIQDLIFYLMAIVVEDELETIEMLIEDERDCNHSAGLPLYGYRVSIDIGSEQSLEELFKRYSYIWDDYFFIESTGMSFEQMQWFEKIKKSISSVDEFLFWTMRLCGWGNYDFNHTFSFYKRLTLGKMKKFYDCPEEVKSWFVPKN